MPAVSVIVPSYNHSRFLRQCIDSVLNQTFSDFELLILDDRSSDDSFEIAASYTDSRVRAIRNEQNLGTYATENAGLDIASGDYAAILNSDDYWDPSKLEKQMGSLQAHPEASFAYTLGDVVNDEGEILESFNQHADWPRTELQDVLPYLLDVNQILASSVVFRRASVRFETKLRYCGDWVAALRLAQKGKAVFINEPLTCWRQHASNSSKDLAKTIGEEIRIRSQILDNVDVLIAKCEDKATANQRLVRCGLDLAAHLVLVGKVREARSALAKSRKHGGGFPVWKRLAATYLPMATARQHLWPGIDAEQVIENWRVADEVDLLV